MAVDEPAPPDADMVMRRIDVRLRKFHALDFPDAEAFVLAWSTVPVSEVAELLASGCSHSLACEIVL